MTWEQRTTYTPAIDAMSAAQIWAAWRAGTVTVYHVATWQQRHGMYFDPNGGIHRA